MSRQESNVVMITATVTAMKEKLNQNTYKKPITELGLTKALTRMNEEIVELAAEFKTGDYLNYDAVRLELADIVNFAGAAIVACDRALAVKKIIGTVKGEE
jgi:NTP pyrophosphatase (non-canonical NTP hydrolase)